MRHEGAPAVPASPLPTVRDALAEVGKAELWGQVPEGTLRVLKDALAAPAGLEADRLAEAERLLRERLQYPSAGIAWSQKARAFLAQQADPEKVE